MTNLPSFPADTKSLAKHQDQIAALARLGTLPSRPIEAGTEAIAKDAMYTALRGVTRYALNEAVSAILRGKLGHTFFPSPVELRQQCDAAMQSIWAHERRVRLTEEQARENAMWQRARDSWTPEAKARAKARWESVKAGMSDKPAEPSITLDPDLVAKVPDAPSTFAQVEVPSTVRKIA